MASRRRQKHRSTSEWQALLDKFAGCGMSVADFCQTEAIGLSSFYRWRGLLGDSQHTLPVPGKTCDAESRFIDLGDLAQTSSGQLNVRLDLGCGVVLHLVRN